MHVTAILQWVKGLKTNMIIFQIKNSDNITNNLRIFPNPANNEINISFILTSETNVKLELYDFLGRKVDIISDKELKKGLNTLDYKTSNLQPGIYFIWLNSQTNKQVCPLTIIK